MCGLAGIVLADPAAPPLIGTVRGMTATLVHRGPDAEGFAKIGPAALGHRRLRIIDLEGGRQPMLGGDGQVALVYNGEVYNFAELRSDLEAAGHRFRTRSDTEVVLRCYLENGRDFVHRLRGMFAIAIYDARDGSLILARDRLGIKPLYYAITHRGVAFGSELKAVLRSGMTERELHLPSLLDYLNLRYVPAPNTIIEGIRKLPPGHMLVYRGGRARVSRYWDLRFDPAAGVEAEEWRERIRHVLEEAVRIRLVSDVPLGAFLSGGIDSSSIVALMSRVGGNGPVKTSTIGFEERAYDELDYARFVSDYLGTDHREYLARPRAAEAMDYLAWHYDEPFGDSSAVPTYYVSQLTRQRVTVALSGDGGDENFAGYRRYYYDRLEHRLRAGIPRFLRRFLLRPLAAMWPKGDFLPRPLRAKTLLTNVCDSPEMAYYRSVGATAGLGKRALLKPDVDVEIGSYDTAARIFELYRRAPAADPLSRAQYVDMMTWLPDDILTKVDRASMAVSLEVRVPFLDHELVELCARIPSELKLEGKRAKAILKDTLSDLLPLALLGRRKQGFAMPVKEWLRTDLREYATAAIFSRDSAVGSYFDLDRVRALWDGHQRGLQDYSDVLWLVLGFAVWSRSFLRQKIVAPPSEAVPAD